ncbi:antitoxin endoai [Bacillus pumilus]|uniref:Antitoxin endoai n=1 Tax=Bacillus pumilus TaxID=1408 RepID=A0AAD0MMQ9_BACPU|nr:antitoxin endoai [Bacillus pumilus]AVM24226.1 antitoxin endoai [Bacillus pumilus]TYS42864.1 antitoxin endoai [Bacillus pumilus]
MGAAVRKLKKPYVHTRHLVDLEVVETVTTVHNPDGTSYIVEPGDVLSVNEFGEKNLVPKNHLLHYFEVGKLEDTSFYEEMAKGYEEMAKINSGISKESEYLESESEFTIAKFVTGKNHL